MHYEYESDDSHNIGSGKRFKVDHGDQFEHRRSHSSDPRVKSPGHPRKRRNFIPPIPHKSFTNPSGTSQNSPRGHSPPLAQNIQPPRRNRMGDDMKLLVFKATGLEHPEQDWFLCDVVWSVKQVVDDAIKMAQLTTTFRDRALNWFMKYSNGQVRTLPEVKVAMIAKFKKPKSESQCITELKEIKQKPNESVWEFDQKFKTLLSQVIFDIDA